ncbi:MAG: M15 family metallopeptidase, partial [Chitinivibrionales bacterium]
LMVTFFVHADSLHLPLEKRLLSQGLVDVQVLDSTIEVKLKYADTTNFMGSNVYGDLRKCYLRPRAAEKLAEASAWLRKHHPGIRLLVVDGVRPRHVSQRMWDTVYGTPKQRYVANPRWGSMHNYGCAVDLTLIDSSGRKLDMGTAIDHFGPLAQPSLEKRYLKSGEITPQQVANRAILREAMTAAGFHPIAIEWWHFNAFDKGYIRKHYSIIE